SPAFFEASPFCPDPGQKGRACHPAALQGDERLPIAVTRYEKAAVCVETGPAFSRQSRCHLRWNQPSPRLSFALALLVTPALPGLMARNRRGLATREFNKEQLVGVIGARFRD